MNTLTSFKRSTPPTVASGIVTITSRLSFSDLNSAAVMMSSTPNASRKFWPMVCMASVSSLALPP